jgi:hypothetical protein
LVIVESQSLAGAAQDRVFQRFPGVMAVTLPRDEGYSDPFRLGSSFVLSGRSNMQEDARDLLEIFKFNAIEETIGRWLRAVIQRLEEERRGIRRKHNEEPS